MKESAKELRERWATGYFEAVASDLRRLLNDDDAQFQAVVDLRGVRVPDDQNQPSDLWYGNCVRTRVANVDLSHSRLEISFKASSVSNTKFDNAVLDRVDFDQAVIIQCSFQKAKLVANMDDTRVIGCDFSGATFGATSSAKEFGGRRTKFTDCNFENALFRRVEFRATRFQNCSFAGARFESCDFRGARFDGASPGSEQFDENCLLSSAS